jgi:hypothetical protein
LQLAAALDNKAVSCTLSLLLFLGVDEERRVGGFVSLDVSSKHSQSATIMVVLPASRRNEPLAACEVLVRLSLKSARTAYRMWSTGSVRDILPWGKE